MKSKLLVITSILFFGAGFYSCSNPGTLVLSDSDKAAITKATTEINQAFNRTKDFKAYVNDYYAEDATILYPNSDAIKGRQGILEALSAYGTDLNVVPAMIEIEGRGDLAYVIGNVKMESNTGKEIDHGKYLEIWKKQKDGRWQVVYDIYNTSIPVPAPESKPLQ